VWKNPWLFLETRTQMLSRFLSQDNCLARPYPKLDPVRMQLPGHGYLREFCSALAERYTPGNPRFNSDLGLLLTEAAERMEEVRSYDMIPHLIEVLADLREVDPSYYNFCLLITRSLQMLLGDEKKQLLGTRGSKPAWKFLKRPITRRLAGVNPLHFYGNVGTIRYLDQSDMVLMPEPEEWFWGLADRYDWPDVDFGQVRFLMEQAYYHQRYVVNPEGAYVQLKHFGPLRSLTLKVKSPGLLDPNYSDFLVILGWDTTGFRSLAGDDELGIEGLRKSAEILEGGDLTSVDYLSHDPRIGSYGKYLFWVVAVIYHDLVTAKEVSGHRSASSGKPRGFSEDYDEEPSWVYIPRRVHNQPLPPRLPSEEPRFVSPHRVTGHLRHANPTPQHLAELEKFERQTRLNVLDLLKRNPGYTFVRPHVSPSWDEVKDLPKFIHARLQSEIEEMMKPTLKDD